MTPQELQNQIDELKREIDNLKNGELNYSGSEFLKNLSFEDVKVATSGATPIYTSYNYGGVGSFAWSSTNAPDGVLVLNLGGKRYWIPVFNPN